MACKPKAAWAYFYPRPPWGGRHRGNCGLSGGNAFLSTPSVGRATNQRADEYQTEAISIHALRGEGDKNMQPATARPAGFLSTPSVGRATCRRSHTYPCAADFYPRPPWGGRLCGDPTAKCRLRISIHALRGEGDGGRVGPAGRHQFISIHALRGEGDGRMPLRRHCKAEFLSTPSVGRATCEGNIFHVTAFQISIHALRGEGDLPGTTANNVAADFYPRPPWGGRLDRPPR